MVIIEFYDNNPLNNICGALLCQPEQVVFVGSDAEKIKRSIDIFNIVLRKKNISTKLSCICTGGDDLDSIVDKLSQIVEHFDDYCTFDLTGGDDLFLVAVGRVMEKYGEKVQCHRFDFDRNQLDDCDANGELPAVRDFDILISDYIAINDGWLVTDPSESYYTYPWNFSSDFLADIDLMWGICRQKPKLWNAQASALGAICKSMAMPSPLQVCFDPAVAEKILEKNREKYVLLPWMLNRFERCGLIRNLRIDSVVSFAFKNEQVKKCLTVAGQLLEMYVASNLLRLKDHRGEPLYHDVKVGAVIKWGDATDSENPIINEIDVIALKGAIPVFISCKNGYFDVNELYKMNTVTERFGSSYARKVIVTTGLGNMGTKGEYLVARMEDMNIKCVDLRSVHALSELDQILSTLWKD